MGWQQPDELPTTLSTLMQKAMNDQPIQPGEGILHHAEGVDLIPANIELAGLEVSLVNCMNREKMLKQVLDSAKREYDFILLDCTPSLGMLTVNALAAADTTLIPVQAQYLVRKGSGTAFADGAEGPAADQPEAENRGHPADHDRQPHQLRTADRQSDSACLRQQDQGVRPDHSPVCPCCGNQCVGKSIFQHDPKGKVAEAYQSLAKEVLADAEKRLKRSTERAR